MSWWRTFWDAVKEAARETESPEHMSNYTPSARRVIELAREEAKLTGGGTVKPEHLMLGLLRLDSGVGIGVLRQHKVNLDGLWSKLIEATDAGGVPKENLDDRCSAEVISVLRRAQLEAKLLHHTYVGSEHLLLGLLREDNGPLADVLKGSSLDPVGLRQKILRALDPSFSAND